MNFERALYWVLVGAQPTDTVRSILSKEGVYLKKHLMGGIKKGAFDEAAAEAKFSAWKADKDAKASDAFDWDRHLAHVGNIYDMILPYILTNGRISEDNLGIRESGNGIPDIIDEARNEVDFFLSIRDE